jgi:hypothetical protein
MRPMSLDTPVALFLFNRPLQTARVFTRIAHMRPRRLFIVADGPRAPADERACQAARNVVADITWPCEVELNYATVNLGSRRRLTSGLEWVFAQCESAIVLEDDCLPELSFFDYCREMLHRYEYDHRVMTISGCSFQFGVPPGRYSYSFSAVPHLWGWATWRRAWELHDANMAQWPSVAETAFPGGWVPEFAAEYHKHKIADTYDGLLDKFDYQWVLASWLNRGLCAMPAVNLISNIGYGPDATHCKTRDACAALPTEQIRFPLIHPPKVEVYHRQYHQSAGEAGGMNRAA